MTDDEDQGLELRSEELTRDEAELARLEQRQETARAARDEALAAVTAARGRLDAETADVRALEDLSPTRLWAVLRGTRSEDLTREQAEQQAADYAVAREEVRHRETRRVLEEVEARIAALGDLPARRRRLEDDRAAQLVRTGAPQATELTATAARLGELASQRLELTEAVTAAELAHADLSRAVGRLDSASSWSSWDTFGGGGLLTDAIKYDRMDSATAALEEADQSLRRLASELADVQVAGVREIGVDSSLRTFDVWFDNLFSDWAVRNRIRDALDAATSTREAVGQVLELLEQRLGAGDTEAATLEARRSELLA